MSTRLPKHLHDGMTAAQLAVDFCRHMDATVFGANLLVRSAVERQLEILGEACRRALDEAPGLRDRIPDMTLAIGLRNRIIHGYDKLDHGVILETVQRDLPGLAEQLRQALTEEPPA